MQVLLVDHDEHRRSRWADQLDAAGVAVTTLDHLGEATEQLSAPHYAAIVVAWTCLEDIDNRSDVVAQLRGQAKFTACIMDRSDATPQAYAAGFDDCLDPHSSAEELSVKMDRVRELVELDLRLAKAQKLESIGELAAGIAHEINTPIQYVGDNTRFVQSAYDDLTDVLDRCQSLVAAIDANKQVSESADELRQAIDAADVEYLQEEVPSAITQTLEGVERVANIVRAMKEFAHPGTSEMTTTDLSKSIENTIMVARNEWKYVAEMETEFDPALPAVPCLPGEINQVLLNMIVNAAHAIADSLGESPEEKGTIRISTKLVAPHVELRISDSGCGIPQEHIEKIFTPFFTTKAAGKGTGQGLAIAHSVVVEKHNGSLTVESVVGEGTTFVIKLPLETTQHSTDSLAANAI